MQVFTKRLLPVLLLFLSISVLAQNKTYYVSSSGNDSNSGTSASNAWRSIGKVNSANLASGDKVLFKRGNRWDEQLKITKSGASGNSIIFGAYGSGAKPILSASSGSYTVTITDRSYITIKDIHVIAPPTAGGISIRGNATNVEIRDCKVEGNSSNRSYTGIVYSVAYQGRYPSRIRIINNDVSRFFQGLLGQDGMKGGGFIEGNRIHSFRPGGEDGIVAKRGNFEGLVIRDNEVTGWLDDGIDLYGGNNVIVEYNRVHDVSRTLNGGGNGIKGGGADAKSDNNIIRYNKVYNIVASSSGVKAGISTNAGDNMKIYGNLVYNVQGEAITVTGGSQNISVYHNTAISTGKQALYISGSAANVSLRNNIFWGIRGDINVNLPTSGRNNLFINGPGGKYSGSNDIKASASEVFASVSNRDYRLKSGSPAIDKGISISGYTSSIDKKSIEGTPDIGAYEYGGSSSPPPTEPKPEPEPAPTPPTDPEPEPESPTGNNGLQYRYYEGSWSTLPNFAGQSVRKQGNVANFNVGVRQREDNFGIVFTGSIQINSGGTYTFYTNSDDGSRLYIDGKQVVNNDGLHAPRERSGSISLSSGRHKIEVQFFERTIGQVLDVRYAGPGVSKRAIPNGVLFPDGGSTNPTPPTDPEPEPESPTGNNGLQYRYYEGSWSTLPNFAGQSVRKQGNVANFNVGVRQREDNFGIVFTGSIQINSGGNYTFYTNSDDGSKLYIDGKQVVDNDGLHAPRERSGSISLSSGRHKIEVQFFERTIGQVLDVRYAGPGVSKRAIPNGVLFPDGGSTNPTPPTDPDPTAGQNGLRYKYYEGRWSQLPNFGSLSVIKSGTLSNFSLSPARTDRYFGFVYTGYIKVDQSGSYTFYTTSDDGSKLYINDKQIVDNDRVHAAQERSGSVSLSAGYHKIEVRYFENAYAEELKVSYQGPGVSKQAIPNNVLFTDRPSNARIATASTKGKSSSLEKNSVSAQEAKSTIIVYPVPLQEELTIDLGMRSMKHPITVTLADHMGRKILEKSILPRQRRKLALYLGNTELLKGVYFVNVTTEGNMLSTFKVIKE